MRQRRPPQRSAGIEAGADASFLTKYGFDLGKNTIPQMEMNWNDYRAATNPR